MKTPPPDEITPPLEIERTICDTEAPPPSEVAREQAGAAGAPPKLARRLAGDLDNIALMALRKEPSRRYQSVEQFSEDIRRYLTGLPVVARRDTFSYRAGKFARRQKAAVTMLALLAALAIALALLVARIARERDRAGQAAATAEAVTQRSSHLHQTWRPFNVRDQRQKVDAAEMGYSGLGGTQAMRRLPEPEFPPFNLACRSPRLNLDLTRSGSQPVFGTTRPS